MARWRKARRQESSPRAIGLIRRNEQIHVAHGTQERERIHEMCERGALQDQGRYGRCLEVIQHRSDHSRADRRGVRMADAASPQTRLSVRGK